MTDEKKPPARDVVAWFNHITAEMVIAEVIDGKSAREIRLDHGRILLLIDAMSSPEILRHVLRPADRDRITRSLLDAGLQELDEAKLWPKNSTK